MIKENFCGICAAIPIALMGAGASASGLRMSKDEYRTKRKWMILGGLVSLFISVGIVLWYRECKSCR